MPKQRLALSWGPSFAETDNSGEWARVYTAQLPIPQLLRSVASGPAGEARVSLSVLRRILDTRLGNSVAQIVTRGFEEWVLLRQEADPGRFDLSPSRREPLANPENLFGVTERISSQGEVLEPLRLAELEKIARDLKKRSIERVCVNLLFTNRNPTHQEQATRFLREQGFQVFSRARGVDSTDELSAWRRNLLDASLSSFFEKLKSETQENLPGWDIQYLDTEKGFVPNEGLTTSGLLFGREKALQQASAVLNFGAEEWCWILPDTRSVWKSPWGALELRHPACGFFSLQPGREIQLTPQGGLRWGSDLGMDPGPMLWGRSSKITLLDLMGWELETRPALRRNEKTEAKAKDQLDAFKKNSRDWAKTTEAQLRKEVMNQLIESLFADLAAAVPSDEFVVGGAFAPVLLPALKAARPKWKWIEADLRETRAFWES